MQKIYQHILEVEVQVAKWSLAVLTGLVLFSAIARTAGMPVKWAVDAATFLFAWCVFLGSDVAMRNDKLFSIDVLTCRLPKKWQYYLKLFNFLIIIVFLLFFILYGIQLAYDTRLRAFQGITGFSYSWVTLSVPVGCLLMVTTAILKVRKMLRDGFENIECTGGGKELL